MRIVTNVTARTEDRERVAGVAIRADRLRSVHAAAWPA